MNLRNSIVAKQDKAVQGQKSGVKILLHENRYLYILLSILDLFHTKQMQCHPQLVSCFNGA